MKSNLMKIVMLALACQFTMSCAKPEEKSSQDKVIITATDKMTSEELVNSAEQLLGPTTFMLSYRLSKMALEKDPTNVKAEFYTKLLARFEAFRGMYVRMMPLLSADRKLKVESDMKNLPESPLKTFLTDRKGGTDLQNIEDVQAVYGQYLKSLSEFYQFLKDKQDSQFNIYLNPMLFAQEIRSELEKNCSLVEDSASKLVVECNASGVATKKLNIADMIALRQIAAGEMLYGIFLNSYSLAGSIEFAEAHKNQKLTTQQTVSGLLLNSRFGVLTKHSLMPQLSKIGSDMGAALDWAMKYQDNVCSPNANSSDKRPGYLFKKGFCVTDQDAANRALILLKSALGGVTTIELKSPPAATVRIDAFAWSRSPIQDLRSVEPTEYSADGVVRGVKDDTLGGIFVDHNFNNLLKQ